MIQRIQSIFLALAVAATGGLFGLPFATTSEEMTSSGLFADSVYNINDHLLLTVAFILAGVFCALALFLFSNRRLQMVLSVYAIIVTVIGSGFAIFKFLSDPVRAQAEFGLGSILPFLIILFAFLARRSIKKDDELVKSMERLR